MHITNDNRLRKLFVTGDRLLVKPTRPDERTASGLYLPPGVQGPGYVIPMPVEDESRKGEDEEVR